MHSKQFYNFFQAAFPEDEIDNAAGYKTKNSALSILTVLPYPEFSRQKK